MTTSHTPGPLSVQQRKASGAWHIYNADGRAIADTNSGADAHLFAAAPELLAALKAVRAYHNGSRPYSVKDIDAAIAKAEGKS